MTNDHSAPERTHTDLPDGSFSDDLRSFLGQPADEPKPATRTRNLRTSFRAVPAAFAPRPVDGRPAGATLEPARPGPDRAPAAPARAKFFKGWRAPVQQAGAGASTDKPVQPADASPAGGRVRGWGRGRSATNSAAVTEPGPAAAGRPRGRPPGSGKKAKQAAASDAKPDLPKDIAKLVGKVEPSAPRAIIPTESERSSATRLFRQIGETFNTNRKKSKTAAYAAFRHDLMANLDTLIMGGAIDLKEATTIITNLEQYTKETEAESTETPATILGRWLRMDAAEVAGLSVGEPGELVANEPDEEDEEEVSAEADPDGELESA